jgi:MFS family permease
LLALAGFRRLLTVRLIGQFGDGLLQVALASFVFFSPERAASPERIAAGFAVLLLPFCIVGPFAGVLLDRWSRQRVLVIANGTRAVGIIALAALAASGAENVGFYVLALLILGINRFILASLSAALPHVVPRDRLVGATSLAPTAGTVAALIGASTGVAIRQTTGGADGATGIVMLAAAAVCLVAALSARVFNRRALGPNKPTTVAWKSAVVDVVRGVRDGLRHLSRRPPATAALLVLTGHRFLYGVSTVIAILLFRNRFFPDELSLAFAGLGLAVFAAGMGVLVGAALTPWFTRRRGTCQWTAMVLILAAVAQLVFGLMYEPSALIAGSFVLGITAQAVKIGVDAQVQRFVADRFLGRVFTLYDLLFNVAYVAAAAMAAAVLPDDGYAPWLIVTVSVGYLLLAWWYQQRAPREITT